MRLTTPTTIVNTAAIQTGMYSRSLKRPSVPKNWLCRRARGDFWARSPASSGRWLVIVGIPNHPKATTSAPATSIHRIDGSLIHAQRPHNASHGPASGRPSVANTPNTSVQRYLPSRCMSIAASVNVTSIGSDWKLRM